MSSWVLRYYGKRHISVNIYKLHTQFIGVLGVEFESFNQRHNVFHITNISYVQYFYILLHRRGGSGTG